MKSCPKCRTETLRGVRNRLAGGAHHPQALRCSRCSGWWVPQTAVGQLPTRNGRDTEVGGERRRQSSDADGRAGLCPDGHGILTRARTPVGEGFFLDRCFDCQGIWFDSGEWSQLATDHLLSTLPDLWSASWQAARRRLEEQASYRERVRAELGDALFTAVEGVAGQLRDHPQRSEALAYLREASRGPAS